MPAGIGRGPHVTLRALPQKFGRRDRVIVACGFGLVVEMESLTVFSWSYADFFFLARKNSVTERCLDFRINAVTEWGVSLGTFPFVSVSVMDQFLYHG